MPRQTTIGRLLLEDAIPHDLRPHLKELTSGGIRELSTLLANHHPEKYRDVMKKLSDVANQAGFEGGGYSFGPEDMEIGPRGLQVREGFRQRFQKILADTSLSPQDRKDKIVHAAMETMGPLETAVKEEATASRNPLAMQVASGAKGSATNLRALIGGDVLYLDADDNPIPYPITHSFGEGLRPSEYLAAASGARKSVIQTKMCLSEGTQVMMADGSSRAIEKICVGDVVVGSDMTGVTSPTKVVAVYSNGLRMCRKYVFRRLMSRKERLTVVATADHEVLARTQEGSFRKGTLVLPSRSNPKKLRLSKYSGNFRAEAVSGGAWSGIDEPRAVILGLMLGDGYLGRAGRGAGHALQFSCGDPELIREISPVFARLGLQLKKGAGYSYMVTRPGIRGGRNPLAEWLRGLGLFGTRSHTKFIPDVVWSWSQKSVAEFIGGLIATDGCVALPKNGHAGGVTFSSVSKQMVETVERLLSVRFGVHGLIGDPVPPDKRMNAVHPLFTYGTYYYESIHRLHASIHVPGVKQRKLDHLVDILRSSTKMAAHRAVPDESEDVGVVPTYDLEVEHGDHLFLLANGLIVGNSTADGGWLAKRLSNVVHRLVVTDRDGEDPHGGVRGLPVQLNDPDNEGALLAAPAGGHQRNAVLTRNVVADLKKKGVEKVLIRSPLVGGPADGGVYGRDVGVRERGGIAPKGDFVGLAASQSLAEPLTQSLLGSKHGGGVAGASKTQTGFPVLERLFSVPTMFPGGAVHAQRDGLVNDIREAPQGGREIVVDGHVHYADPELEPKVKAGDRIEAGDPLTDGIERPDELVIHKGIGEARRRFLDVFGKHGREAGMKFHRRNVELVARGLIDHVEMDQEMGEHVPGDIVSYTSLENSWEPRPGHKIDKPKNTVGMYLERPALHYTIGTRITPRVADHLDEHGVSSVTAHAEPPPFTPVMIRSNDVLAHDKDWMTQGLGSGIYDSLLKSTARGSVSNPAGTSFVPALAEGVHFGETGTKTKGWNRADIEPVKL